MGRRGICPSAAQKAIQNQREYCSEPLWNGGVYSW